MDESLASQSAHYLIVKQAIEYLDGHFQTQPSLEEIAAGVHLSKFHFQRVFKEWAGISPKQFLHFLTLEYARTQLRNAHTVLDTSLRSGLTSPSRLHDLFVNFEAVTPGDHRRMGEDLRINFGFHLTPFGECLLAFTDRGICALRFVQPKDRSQLLSELKTEWPLADFTEDAVGAGALIRRIFQRNPLDDGKDLRIYVKGTNFQIQVWRALLDLDCGKLVSYQEIAAMVNKNGGARAVGNALAKNPVAYLIPCHRVIRKSGTLQNYRWGSTRKKAIIAREAGQLQGGR